MKQKIRFFVAIIITVLVGMVTYYNIIVPITIEVKDVKCENWDATFTAIKAFEENFNKDEYDKDTTKLHNFDGKLPSENPKDYMSVYISLGAKNRSLFESYIIDGVISKIETNQEMALYSTTLGAVERMQVFRNSEKDGMLVLDIYIGDYSDEEIKEFINSITIQTVCKGSLIGKKEMSVSLKNVKDITIER